MNSELKNLRSQIEEYQYREKMYKKLGTRQGFFQYYFEQLPKHRTNVECFNQVNDLYMDLFGEERYSDFNSFRHQANHYNKNNQ